MNYVLDASAVVALIREERADFDLKPLVPGQWISAVNFAEIVEQAAQQGNERAAVYDLLDGLTLSVVEANRIHAYDVGMWRQPMAKYGLSLGDRFCLALARYMQLPILTTDHRLADGAEELELEVRRVRQRS